MDPEYSKLIVRAKVLNFHTVDSRGESLSSDACMLANQSLPLYLGSGTDEYDCIGYVELAFAPDSSLRGTFHFYEDVVDECVLPLFPAVGGRIFNDEKFVIYRVYLKVQHNADLTIQPLNKGEIVKGQ